MENIESIEQVIGKPKIFKIVDIHQVKETGNEKKYHMNSCRGQCLPHCPDDNSSCSCEYDCRLDDSCEKYCHCETFSPRCGYE